MSRTARHAAAPPNAPVPFRVGPVNEHVLAPFVISVMFILCYCGFNIGRGTGLHRGQPFESELRGGEVGGRDQHDLPADLLPDSSVGAILQRIFFPALAVGVAAFDAPRAFGRDASRDPATSLPWPS